MGALVAVSNVTADCVNEGGSENDVVGRLHCVNEEKGEMRQDGGNLETSRKTMTHDKCEGNSGYLFGISSRAGEWRSSYITALPVAAVVKSMHF